MLTAGEITKGEFLNYKPARTAEKSKVAIKPLFIPLKTEYFMAFLDGTKTVEYRPYGPRWNEDTCPPTRPVVISKGYGKYQRLAGYVQSFTKIKGLLLPWKTRKALTAIYGTYDMEVACISVHNLTEVEL